MGQSLSNKTLHEMTGRILVIKLSALGDFIVALGAMAAIRKHHASDHITLLTTKPFLDIARRSGYFDDILVDTRPPFYELTEWFRLYTLFNRGQYSRVYDLQLNDRTSIYYRLFRRKPEWSGTIHGASHYYNNPPSRKIHAFERHKEMLAELRIPVELPDLSWMKADVSHLMPKKPYILFIPGSAPQHPEKRWPAENYGLLASNLIALGFNVAVIGTATEASVITSISEICPQIHNLCGRTTFYDIASLAVDAFGTVGNDTGPTHLTALSGCPTVAIFSGTTQPERSAPVGFKVNIIQQQDLKDLSVESVLNFLKKSWSL